MSECNVHRRIDGYCQYGKTFFMQKLLKFMVYRFENSFQQLPYFRKLVRTWLIEYLGMIKNLQVDFPFVKGICNICLFILFILFICNMMENVICFCWYFYFDVTLRLRKKNRRKWTKLKNLNVSGWIYYLIVKCSDSV